MEEDDDEGEENPEEWMETAYPRSSSVQLQNMLLVCWSFACLFHMNHMFQIVHVFMIAGNVKKRSDRVSDRAVESESREVGKSLKIGKNRIKSEKSDLISY